MIIVKLCGGLGNQLFQYSLGRHLALKHRATVKFDAAAFEADPLRDFALGPYGLDIDWAAADEIRRLSSPPKPAGMARLVPKPFRPNAPSSHIREAQVGLFEARILDISDGVYLDGYWQSERYFADIAPTIRRELALDAPPRGANALLLDRIRATTSVSLHVRRGDYVSNPKTRAHHGLCDIEYYRWAVGRLSESVDQPEFFVFSDEPEWARRHLDLGFPTSIVDVNDAGTPHEDLRLMSACRHHIIANSSFSWWGAWLNSRPDKIVIAPSRWLAGPAASCPDILPADWIRSPD